MPCRGRRWARRHRCLVCRLIIVGGGREAWSVWGRGSQERLWARGPCPTWVPGPSTSPLEAVMAPISALRWFTSAVLVGSFVCLLGCASAARIDVEPIAASSPVPNVYELAPSLDGLLRTLGYEKESESDSKSVREHGAYWKSLPPSGGESLFENLVQGCRGWERTCGPREA